MFVNWFAGKRWWPAERFGKQQLDAAETWLVRRCCRAAQLTTIVNGWHYINLVLNLVLTTAKHGCFIFKLANLLALNLHQYVRNSSYCCIMLYQLTSCTKYSKVRRLDVLASVPCICVCVWSNKAAQRSYALQCASPTYVLQCGQPTSRITDKKYCSLFGKYCHRGYKRR